MVNLYIAISVNYKEFYNYKIQFIINKQMFTSFKKYDYYINILNCLMFSQV